MGWFSKPNAVNHALTNRLTHRLQGHLTCTNYWASSSELSADPEIEETYDATYDFYQNLWAKAFEGSPFDESAVNFNHAYDLWDYASYQYNHNATVRGDSNGTEPGLLNVAEVARLHQLANQQQYSLHGNLTAHELYEGDKIRAIAGRTLAGRINSQFQAHLASQQQTRKLNLMFGSFEPFLSFFALAALADEHSSGLFMQIPPPGSAMVFELFSVGGESEADAPVDEDTLWVRFLYRNGTGADEPLREYPLFGRPNAETTMPWNDFYRLMDDIAVSDWTTWCELCDSANLFCGSLIDNSGDGDSSSSSSTGNYDSDQGSLSPAVAGVIGALTAFAALTLLAAGIWVFAGVHLTRRTDPRQRSTSLGGFRGAEKMASDHDVSIAGNGAKHSRVGSWELGGPGAPQVPPPAAFPVSPLSSDGATVFGASIKRDDDDDDDVNRFSGVTPVSPRESV